MRSRRAAAFARVRRRTLRHRRHHCRRWRPGGGAARVEPAKATSMGVGQAVLVLAGAVAGGLVNGLTGFGTALTALGIWLYAIDPAVASSLVIFCSVFSQLQTMHLIWRAISWRRVFVFIVPGVVGVPIGTLLLPHISPWIFKLVVGGFLVIYSSY